MVTNSNLVYSSSAAARILGIVYQKRIVVKEWFSVVWVWVQGYRPRFVSKSAFKQHFVNWRKAAARALAVIPWHDDKTYTVTNYKKGSRYNVRCHKDMITCNCDDYQNQLKFLGKGCCKHGYAVLNHLGHSSLESYLSAQSVASNSIIPFAPRQRPTTFAGVSID